MTELNQPLTPDFMGELETPSTENQPEVIAPPEEKLVTMTQEKLNKLIVSRMGAAGRMAKEEAAKLRIENERLKQLAAGQGSEDELERVRGELAASRLEQQAILDASVRQQKDLIIAQEANAHDFIDVTTLQQLTRKNLRHNPQTNSFEPISDDGTPMLNADQTPMTVSQFFADFGNKRPFLQRGQVKSGPGSTGSQGAPPVPVETWHKYFGAKSDARAANALAMRNKPLYDRLKAQYQKETNQ